MPFMESEIYSQEDISLAISTITEEFKKEWSVVFPDGVGVLPWMLCGTNEIGEATAKKM
jgi:ribulose-5-phosphate 4-epimerase/fuculose-1-phosphate aldolase